MLHISFWLVILSFLGAAFLASLDPLVVNWTYFVPVIAAGFVGVYLHLSTLRAAAQHSDLLHGNRKILLSSLANIVTNLEKLDQGKTEIPTYDMRFEIDRLFRQDLSNFADARDSLKHLYGIQAYADVMSAFAAGERYINRVWSASTDGYIDEVNMYVGKSLNQFHEAKSELDRVTGK